MDINIVQYNGSEQHLDLIKNSIDRQLSEPYPIFTYQFFLINWPELALLAFTKDEKDNQQYMGTIVSKLQPYKGRMRGYIAMLEVQQKFRKQGLGKKLVVASIKKMMEMNADQIVLETQVTNLGALNLYESCGFIREKKLICYYLNGNDAFRLKLMINSKPSYFYN